MGIINHDAFVSRFGPSFTDTYIAIHTNDIDVRKQISDLDDPGSSAVACYHVTFTATVWATQADKTADKSAIGNVTFSEGMETTTPLDMNIYAYAYSKVTVKFPNSTNV